MKALIIEDVDSHYRILSSKIASVCPHVEVTGRAASCEQAIQQIQSQQPDLIFLDIHLPDGEGFDILRGIAPLRPAVIFVTGFEEHIWRAFEFSAIDYLLKPVDPDKLVEAVNRAEERNRIHILAEQYAIFEQSKSGRDQRIALSNQEVAVFRRLDEIIFLEANDHKTQFYFRDYFMEVSKRFGDYEDLLLQSDFLVKTHRSYIVNVREILHFIRNDWQLFMTNGKTVSLGEQYRTVVLDKLRAFCGESKGENARIELSDQRVIAFPYLRDILYLEAAGTTTLFYIKGYKKTFVVTKNLGEFADHITLNTDFMRVHRSYVVNLRLVKYYSREEGAVICQNGEPVPVSEQYKSDVLTRLKQLT